MERAVGCADGEAAGRDIARQVARHDFRKKIAGLHAEGEGEKAHIAAAVPERGKEHVSQFHPCGSHIFGNRIGYHPRAATPDHLRPAFDGDLRRMGIQHFRQSKGRLIAEAEPGERAVLDLDLQFKGALRQLRVF